MMIVYYCALIIILLLLVFLIICKSQNNFNAVFDDIYTSKEWGSGDIGGGSSGTGSNIELNRKYVLFLEDFIKEFNIKSIVDIGCGDWQIMKHINLGGIKYIGYDVSKQVIDNNNKLYKRNNISFVYYDLDSNMEYAEADLLICKDVLQHLAYKNINKIISQFNKYKYTFIINDMYSETNTDIKDGGWRSMDIRKAPFMMNNLNNSIHLWDEEPIKTLLY